MYASVMRAPLQFFESTTVGTILNRFSRDVYVADEVLSRVFGGFWRTAFQVTGVILVVSFAVPLFLVVIIP
jgi:ABC-type bacteriocin/lantibiotic exporter with double-glycine peptidase domain